MNATSHDHHSSSLSLSKFEHACDFNMMDERGYIRPKDVDGLGIPMGKSRQINATVGLGMVIMWYCTRGSFTHNLALLVGQTCTPMYK